MKARKDTIKIALQAAKKAKYPIASRKLQSFDEWKDGQDQIIKTLKELLK